MDRRSYADYYSHTSEARQPLWDKSAQPRRKRVKKVRNETNSRLEYRNVGQTSGSFSSLSIITLVLLFVVAIGIVMSFAMIADKTIAVRNMTNELRQIEEDNNLIRTQIAQSYDIREIERLATTRLMMGRPQPHQIVHIYVPRASHTVTNIEITPQEPSRSIIDRLFNRG